MLNDFLRLQGNILVPQTKPQAKQQTIARKLSSAERRFRHFEVIKTTAHKYCGDEH